MSTNKKNVGGSPDGFTPLADNPYGAEHLRLNEYLSNPKESSLLAESGKFEKTAQLSLLCAALERVQFQKKGYRINAALSELVKKLAGRKLSYTEEHLAWCLSCAANILAPKDPKHLQTEELYSPFPGLVPALLTQLETLLRDKPLSKELLEPLTRVHAALAPIPFWAGYRTTVRRLEGLLAQKLPGMPDDGDAWVEVIRRDIAAMAPGSQKQWLALLENAPKGTTASPTAEWKKKAYELLAAVGPEKFAAQIEQWFALVGAKASERIRPRNATLLRSLVWYAGLLTGDTVCRALANVVEGGLRKVARGGLYASSIVKACITALEAMPGLEPAAQLSRLRHRIKSPWGLAEVEQALATVVQRSGISRAEIEEISLPTFGLDQDGGLSRQVGEHTAKLQIVGTQTVELKWYDASGKELVRKRDLPKSHASEQKALKQLAGDIEKMLGAQRDRIENFLERERAWTFANWEARYLNHPLVSHLSRRLIWQCREGNQAASGIWYKGQLVEFNGHVIEWLGPNTEVRLWHPLGLELAQVQAWRQWLQEQTVTQPFKQAHREIYLLTDAELGTQIYSNRFAAHILRQHQFKALCDQRGWHYDFLGSWDQPESVATRDLPGWELRAEFWIEHAGTEFAPSGAAMHVATDQVRFCTPDQQVMALADVPALVFSEIMRDVDLFVSVCSVGNDPTWADGGVGRQREYWREWAFGTLNATAATRREILERLLPKLKIASQCVLQDKFLVVTGNLRAYKIHLGSGNILMEPNDQYLCIVPDRGQASLRADEIFLPFEGDGILSVILSKAFLLAEDSRIKDRTILRQITSQ